MVVVDENTITIRANYYTGEDSKESAEYAANYWNNLSNVFQMDGYDIVFDIEVIVVDPDKMGLTGENKEFSALRAKANTDEEGIGNVYLLTNDLSDNYNGNSDGGQIARVRPSRAFTETGAHEMGHGLGLGHYFSGLMTDSSSDPYRSDKITKIEITDIIKGAVKGKPVSDPYAGKGKIRYNNGKVKFKYKTNEVKK